MKKILLPNNGLSRRHFLTLGAGAALALAAGPALATHGERRLAFLNLHTGESLKATYWQDGHYVEDELAAINHVLRDHRASQAGDMAPQLLDMLHVLQGRLGISRPFEVISGYRSPQTNAMLRSKSSGVAQKSRHMLGQAIDVRLPGKQLEQLLHAARDLRAGGVGYYPRSQFVHLDTGPYRTWNG